MHDKGHISAPTSVGTKQHPSGKSTALPLWSRSTAATHLPQQTHCILLPTIGPMHPNRFLLLKLTVAPGEAWWHLPQHFLAYQSHNNLLSIIRRITCWFKEGENLPRPKPGWHAVRHQAELGMHPAGSSEQGTASPHGSGAGGDQCSRIWGWRGSVLKDLGLEGSQGLVGWPPPPAGPADLCRPQHMAANATAGSQGEELLPSRKQSGHAHFFVEIQQKIYFSQLKKSHTKL